MPHLEICFLQVTSPEIYEYSQYSTEINKKYCSIHGYNYLELTAIKKEEYHAAWSKIFHTKSLLEEGLYTHVFSLDADAVVINRDKKIEDIAAKMQTPIAFSENGLNGGDFINTGSFIASENAVAILDKCIELSHTEMSDSKLEFTWEQRVINKIHADGIKMDVFPMNEINSHWLYDINSNDGQFVFHFMARSLADKVKIAKKLFEKYGL